MQTNSELQKIIEKRLADFLPKSEDKVVEAAKYSLLAGGKRIRPAILIASYASLPEIHRKKGLLASEQVLTFALALEAIHTYSLIHDDLPAMDNDDLRRGKPTNHVLYGEGMAILAGDYLLNFALEKVMQVAYEACSADKNESLASVDLIEAGWYLAKLAGSCGMICGQSKDLDQSAKQNTYATAEAIVILKRLQAQKTGALLEAAYCLPLVMTRSLRSEAEHEALSKTMRTYAQNIGAMFQIQDDLLDVQAKTDKLGKSVGKDQRDQKMTYVTCLGIDNAKSELEALAQHNESLMTELKLAGLKLQTLQEIAQFLNKRDH